MKEQFYINTYSFAGGQTLGFSYFGEQIFEFDLPDKIQSYSFKVQLFFTNEDRMRILDGTNYFETIKGIYTGNLKEFEHEIDVQPFLKYKKNKQLCFDWFTFLNKHFSQEFELAKTRLLRKKKNTVPKIIFYKESGEGFRENKEFLEFDESAFNWAGPFETGEKKGCIVDYGQNKQKTSYPILNVKTDHSFYHLPDKTRQKLGKSANDHWKLTPKEKKELFNSLSVKDQYETARNYFKQKNGYLEEMLAQTQPFRIYLAGNDDYSYTKWFSTEEEMNEELRYLRLMQPLNFFLDIAERGYIFTN
jgi:hypothetical protein